MGPFQTPAFAPDGNSVALVLNRDGANAIYIVSTDGERAARLSELEGAAALAWSPGGERMAFIDGRYSPTGGVVGKLWVADQSAGRIELVSDSAAGFFWSPDSTKLVYLEPFIVRAGEDSSIFLYRIGIYHTLDGRTDALGAIRPTAEFVRQIMPFFDQYHRAYTIWSPDSRLIALNAVAENGVPVIHLVDTELRRSGDAFSVAYRIPVQTGMRGGFFPVEGVSSRILGLGTIPFFNSRPAFLPGTVS
jgi:Tol biopolymer transport system component